MERILNSSSIEQNFSKKVKYYDTHANIQKIMANELFNLIKSSKKYYGIIFEIGCGTGLLTEYLVKIRPKLLIVNDISSKMLEILKEKISFNNIIYINFNFLEINNIIKSDLICSNAVFQWIFDLDSLFSKINTFLNNGGTLAFSTFIDGTFKELDKAFNEAYLSKGITPKKHTLHFYYKEEIKDFLFKHNFNILEFFSYEYKMFYKTPIDFLKSVHNIGAILNNEKKVGYTIMKKMLDSYKKLFTTNNENKVYATYDILFCVAQKI